jgi:hypothetical protein
VLQELQELNLDVSTEELLSAERAFTYADLYAVLGNENHPVLLLTPNAAVARGGYCGTVFLCSYLRDGYGFLFNVNGKAIHVLARSSEAFSDIVDVVHRLLLADVSEVNELEFGSLLTSVYDERFFNAASLANLMEQCQSQSKGFSIGIHDLGWRSLPCAWGSFKARPRDRAETL